MSMYYGDSSGKAKKIFIKGSKPSAEDLLESIKSVDGAGSGLDADLLDGKHASEFAQLGEDGKIPTDSLPANVGKDTATEILAKLKTVDGARSGLDADLLDGKQGSDYQPVLPKDAVRVDGYAMGLANQIKNAYDDFLVNGGVNAFGVYNWLVQYLSQVFVSGRNIYGCGNGDGAVAFGQNIAANLDSNIVVGECIQGPGTLLNSSIDWATTYANRDSDFTSGNFSGFRTSKIYFTSAPPSVTANQSVISSYWAWASNYAPAMADKVDNAIVKSIGENYIELWESIKIAGQGTESNNRIVNIYNLTSQVNVLGVDLVVPPYSMTTGSLLIGNYNDETKGGAVVVGGGVYNSDSGYTPSNLFRIDSNGKGYFKNGVSNSGADFAEYFEVNDLSLAIQDLRGRFVTLDGDKLRIATNTDDFILGIISSDPAITGNSYDEEWIGKYDRDIFGAIIYHEEQVPMTSKEGDIKYKTERMPQVAKGFDIKQIYKGRSERDEWKPVALVGQVVVVDDGTCQVNGYCLPGKDGIATVTSDKRGYRVMKRKDANHVLVYVHGRIIL